MIITTDTHATQWFMNWRIGRYYLPQHDFWVLYKVRDHRGVQLYRRDSLIRKSENTTVRLPVFTYGRILWLIEPQSEIHRQLDAAYELGGGRYVFYTDLNGEYMPVHIDGVEISPAPFGY
jgi:hypothetical protein